MCKIVDNNHAAFLPANFGAAAHVLKSTQRAGDNLAAQSPSFGGDDHCQTVQQIEVADQRRFKLAPRLAFADDGKLAQLAGEIHFAETPLRLLIRAEGFELREESTAH